MTSQTIVGCGRLAEGIGHRLSGTAIWHEGRCSWMGAEPLERPDGNTAAPVTYRSLPPDLYFGTSGVGLFLAELHAVTGDLAARRTALGALRHALSRVDVVPSAARLGLFSGWLGIAFAAARVGTLLEEGELLERARELVERSTRARVDERAYDLISGRAGGIAALLALDRILGDGAILELAARLGDELLATAEGGPGGYSWRAPEPRGHRNLTGFSHGTAGVGYALLELSHAVGDRRYRNTAEHAFAYERHWFSPETGNWPDFREDRPRGRGRQPLPFQTLWCHGAPGIAFARLRAYELLRDDICRAEATIALRTTAKRVRFSLQAGTENFSLCHGLAGNADALLYGADVLGLTAPTARS